MRRLCMAVLLLVQCVLCAAAHAADAAYPQRPIRLIVLFPPGGSDTVARIFGQRAADRLGQPFVIDNRPGAAGVIGADIAAKSPPDGYTLLFATASFAMNSAWERKLPYDAVRDFVPVVGLVQASNIVIAAPDAPFSSITELIAVARAKPGALNYGSFGPGSNNHLGTERFAMEAGVSFTHIPYKGGVDIMRSIMASDIHFAMTGLTAALPLIKQGRMKAIAWTGVRRTPALPDVPTVSEGLPGYDTASWFGWFAPAGTPPAVLQKIAADALRVLAQPEVREKLVSGVGLEPLALMPDAFAQLVSTERGRNEALVKRLGLQQN